MIDPRRLNVGKPSDTFHLSFEALQWKVDTFDTTDVEWRHEVVCMSQ